MRCPPLSILLLWAGLAATASAQVELRLDGARLHLRASGAPLADVLDRVAAATGMSVRYERGRPREPVTADLRDVGQVEALRSLLEGAGAEYLLTTDPPGTRVLTLVVDLPEGPPAGAPPPAPFEEAFGIAVQAEAPVEDDGPEPDEPPAGSWEGATPPPPSSAPAAPSPPKGFEPGGKP
jgi:hypothetical protein